MRVHVECRQASKKVSDIHNKEILFSLFFTILILDTRKLERTDNPNKNRSLLGSSQHLVRKFTGFFSKKSVKLGRGLSLSLAHGARPFIAIRSDWHRHILLVPNFNLVRSLSSFPARGHPRTYYPRSTPDNVKDAQIGGRGTGWVGWRVAW